ncbi:hypothetical protein H4219_005704 [Mycoemilia scoparia]|uniref:Protein CMS1 n=1 Tax=Mycoemilia scoparia TaxID=417184 RepID=A0A9W8DJC4_9FUNG|nr:hypothetical protein H4219_005704 [Mycoemilia scoparia]
MADTLEDDFLIEDAYILQQNIAVENDTSGSSSEKQKSANINNKRKAVSKDTATNLNGDGVASKKSKTKKQKYEQISTIPQTPDGQKELWNKCMKKAFKDISQLEFDGIAINEKSIYVPDKEIKVQNGDPEYLKELITTSASNLFSKNFKHKGAPRVLIICSSAIRAVDLVRRCRPLSKRMVGKLFSKHMKIKDQQQNLAKFAMDIVVGTPNRILKLVELGDLKLGQLKLVLVDCTKDSKMRVCIDMDEVRDDLYKLWKDYLNALAIRGDDNDDSGGRQDEQERKLRIGLFESQ